MRILIFGINYSPEQTGIGPYTTAMAEHFVQCGHEVEVVTGVPSYPEWKIHPEFRRTIHRRSHENGVLVHRFRLLIPVRQSATARLGYETSFMVMGLLGLLTPKPDLVIGVVPSLSGGVLARAAASRFRCRYALIFQDLVSVAASQSGVVGGARVVKALRLIERWICSRATQIGIIADGFRPHLQSLGANREQIRRIRNWALGGRATGDRLVARKTLGVGDQTVLCVHAGNMGHKQGLENIVSCADLADKRDVKVRFVLIGDGNQRERLECMAKSRNLSNLAFLPLQPQELLPEMLAAADILLLNQRDDVAEMALPSKLTAYLSSGRPIIAAVHSGSEAARELERSGGGIVVEPDDPEALLDVIVSLAEDKPAREHLGRSGKAYAKQVLAPELALQRLEDMLNDSVQCL